jgi:glycosyltransferase involved in cell wall biosynthesis
MTRATDHPSLKVPLAPKVSIVVNCYNGAAFLGEALDSVIAQSWLDYELIFVDNHSTDASRQIFDSYGDRRFRCVLPDQFMPLGAARNFGVTQCAGEFIAFLDADDIWLPDKLSHQLAELSSSDADALYSQATMFYPDARERPYSPRGNNTDISFADLAAQFDLCLSTLVLRQSFLCRLDRVFDDELEVAEDADLLLRIAHDGHVRYFNEISARYRVHCNSDSWRKPEAFLSDLARIDADYRRRGMDADALKPLFDTAHWVVTMARWAAGNHRGARSALCAIRQRSLRIYMMLLLLVFPYPLVAPILRFAGKRVI